MLLGDERPILAHPLPAVIGQFPRRMQSESIHLTEGQLLFDPRMRVMHDFIGWLMRVDIRRNSGYGTVIVRLHDRATPLAWITFLRAFSIPMLVVGKTIISLKDCLRWAENYGICDYEIPVVSACSLVVMHWKHRLCGMRSGGKKRPWTQYP